MHLCERDERPNRLVLFAALRETCVCAHLLATLAVFPVLIAQQSLTAPLSCKTLILLERLPHSTSCNLGIFIEALSLCISMFFSFSQVDDTHEKN